MECSNCGQFALMFITEEEWTNGFDTSVEPDWSEEGDLAEPDWDDECTLDDE
jgi:hypothetical protein